MMDMLAIPAYLKLSGVADQLAVWIVTTKARPPIGGRLQRRPEIEAAANGSPACSPWQHKNKTVHHAGLAAGHILIAVLLCSNYPGRPLRRAGRNIRDCDEY
jgi:hypothetical protein